MTKFRDLLIDIQDEIEQGDLSYKQLATKYNVSYLEVLSMAKDLREFQDELYSYE